MAERIAVLGAGSWGMAVADLLDRGGHAVTLWEFDESEFRKLVKHRGQPEKLSDFQLGPSIALTNDLQSAVSTASLLVLAIPSQSLRSALRGIRDVLPGTGVVNLAKGIEVRTLKRMSEVIAEELGVDPRLVATLSGPSHAEEVVRGMPTAVVAAGVSRDFTAKLQEIFSNASFRVYQSDDLVGVELGGSLKNIIAIGAGIAEGLGMGDNTLGAILTRGLAEITRLGVAMGAQPETFAGLSGIGDLITTCVSRHSRNRFVGDRIGRGERLENVLAGMTMVAEGVQTTRSGHELAGQHEVEMPITDQVYHVLFEGKAPAEAVEQLMERKLKPEIWK
ncbi:MAG: NAD(P)-dependent glycerol-3-phosphate dehydrogenase [candidate division Zixibacteria bacterium]|nr:NAD(P)-dependent glycerol-3-phosphate dehydrogenase [candidate division Zixibacteria bacterium]